MNLIGFDESPSFKVALSDGSDLPEIIQVVDNTLKITPNHGPGPWEVRVVAIQTSHHAVLPRNYSR